MGTRGSGEGGGGCKMRSEVGCFHFVVVPTDVTKTTTECDSVFQIDGAYLLSVNSEEEHAFISQWLTRHDMNR